MMADETCTIGGCERPRKARGWCGTHHERWRRNGTTDDLTPATEERFWAKVTCGDCWEWTGACGPDGYGRFKPPNSVPVLAHRYAYELLVGRIPDGLQIDHLCRVRACVNPDHLEPVTQRENILRGEAPTAVNARKSQCKNGHPYDLLNTYWRPDGGRDCRVCQRERNRGAA